MFLLQNVTRIVKEYYEQRQNYERYEVIPTDKQLSMEFPTLPKATVDRINKAHDECKARNDGDSNASKEQVEGHPEMKNGGHQQQEQKRTSQKQPNTEIRFDEQESDTDSVNKEANEVPWEVRKSKNRKAQQKVHGKEPNRDGEITKAKQKPKPKQKPKTWKK